MEPSEVKKVVVAKKTNAASLRVKAETRKRIVAELAKVNRKSFGRKIRVDQLLNMLLSLVDAGHIQKLQDESLSNSDRLEIKYREHVKKHGAVSKDEFLGLLIGQNEAKGQSESAAAAERK
jgi:hypothetical protein